MKSSYNLKPGSREKRLFLTVDDKQSLDKIISEQINRLTILQQTLQQSQISELEEEDIKGVILKTEYFLFKLKVHIKKIMSNKKILMIISRRGINVCLMKKIRRKLDEFK